MKATLKFKLNKERSEFETAMAGGKLLTILQEFDNYLKTFEDAEEQVRTEIGAEIREKLWDLMKDQNIDVWEM